VNVKERAFELLNDRIQYELKQKHWSDDARMILKKVDKWIFYAVEEAKTEAVKSKGER
jgi:hypothetical protein